MLLCQPPPLPVSADDVICESPREATDGPRAFHDHSTPPAASGSHAAAAASPSLSPLYLRRPQEIHSHAAAEATMCRAEGILVQRTQPTPHEILLTICSPIQFQISPVQHVFLWNANHARARRRRRRQQARLPPQRRRRRRRRAGGGQRRTAAARENIQDQQPETEPIHLSCRRAAPGRAGGCQIRRRQRPIYLYVYSGCLSVKYCVTFSKILLTCLNDYLSLNEILFHTEVA